MQTNSGSEAVTAKPALALPPEDPTEALFDSLLGFAKVIRSVGPEHMPLPWLQFMVLRRLARSDGDLRLTGVTGGLGYDISVMSRQINTLVDGGLVTRERDPNDGRAWLLRLTDAGRQRLDEASRRCLTVVRESLESFDDADLALCAQLVWTLNLRMTHKLREARHDPPPKKQDQRQEESSPAAIP